MNKFLTELNPKLPFPDVFPKSWNERMPKRDYLEFRNLDHFRFIVSKLTQKNDDNCDMTYGLALQKLIGGISDFPETEQVSIRNLVRSNLHKRGLITEEVYEQYKYSVEGTQVGVDPAKYAAGEPDCVLTPTRQYIDFFYELYISISYPHFVTNEKIRENCAKLLATIEELERQHIFIKIALILPINRVNKTQGSFFASMPMFSHKEHKSVETMSSVVNDRLLRKFFFAILENYYELELDSCYGTAVNLDDAMCIGNDFSEVDFFEEIVKAVGA